VNLGQLKAVSQPFYDLLWANGYTNAWPENMTTGPYPWSGVTNSPNDYALAKIGQLKYLFSFNLIFGDMDMDTDGDGLPDEWEELYELDSVDDTEGNGAAGDPDRDGFLNLYEYVHGSNPTNGDSIPSPTRYVSLAGSHRPPFATWETAATNIQAALSAATDDHEIIQIMFRFRRLITLDIHCR